MARGQEDPSEIFLRAYQNYQAGEKLEGESSPARALERYREALELLESLAKRHPDWQPLVVEYRTKRTRESIARLEASGSAAPAWDVDLEGPLPSPDRPASPAILPPVTTAPAPRRSGAPLPTTSLPPSGGSAALSRALEEIAALRQQLAEAQRESERLARRAEKAEAELKSARVEVDRTKVTVVELKSQLAQVTQTLENLKKDRADFEALRQARKKESEDFAKRLAQVEADYEVLKEENEALLAKLERAAVHIAESEKIRSQLLEERQKLAAERQQARKELEEATAKAAASAEELARLRVSNKELEKALAEARKGGASQQELDRLAKANKELERKLAAAERRLAAGGGRDAAVEALQSELNSVNDRLLAAQAELTQRDRRIEELQQQLDEVSGELARLKLLPVPTSEEQRLLAENDLLRGIILRQIKMQTRRDEAARMVEEELARLKVQSQTLAAHLATLTAPILELTAEENALFKDPVTLLTEDEPGRMEASIAMAQPTEQEAQANLEPPAPQGASDLDEDARAMVREARELFEAGRFIEAEKIYQRLVERTPENYFVLANLGAVQIEAGKLAAAEIALEKATTLSPNDAFAFTHLGIARSRQGRFAEARAALERAIAINGADAVPYNYLAICLAQEGDREGAEASLKKSIELDPNYANAHFNLAVLYATTKPPALELAKRHYQQATSLGAAPDASLERLIQ